MLKWFKGLKLKTKIIIIVPVVFILAYIIFGGDYRNSQNNTGTTNAENNNNNVSSTALPKATQESSQDIRQKSLIKRFGEPPKGFKWKDDGTLEAIGDAELSAEDVMYAFVKGCTMLDFATAERYSDSSSVVETYRKYFEKNEDDATHSTDTSYERNIYKSVLTTLNIESINDTAVFADGETAFNLSVRCIDLSNKDFWKKDKKEIFNKLWNLYEVQDDKEMVVDYLYSYISDYYTSKNVVTTVRDMDLRVGKGANGYLVIDDADFNAICTYKDGVQVQTDILTAYDEWALNKKNEIMKKKSEKKKKG